MRVNKGKASRNVQYAERWLNRAMKDFDVFKRIVPFDRRTEKPVRCSDPALAVYLLQQSVEKAVKATAIASEQYTAREIRRYGHNSLALIINLYKRVAAKFNSLGLHSVPKMMSIDLVEGEAKLDTLEQQVMGKALSETGKKVNFKAESINESAEKIDKILDELVMILRSRFLDTIRATFAILPDMGIRKGKEGRQNDEEFLKRLSDEIAAATKTKGLSGGQLEAVLEFIQEMGKLGFTPRNDVSRKEMIIDYLGVWAFSIALLFLTFFTFAHESTSRYPLRQKGNVEKGKIGCDDYNQSLGIVNRIGKIGYVTSLTLYDIRKELKQVALFFAIEEVH